MGWASATYIFDDTARVVVDLIDAGDLTEAAGKAILVSVAKSLRSGDWDTESESEFWGGDTVAFEALVDVFSAYWDDDYKEYMLNGTKE